jgi:glycosidase
MQGLGATALWITPPVANQWLDPSGSYAGYHGYWAEHFMQVDRHLGTLDDYRALSHALHRRGMYLVQDIVLNHTGNYFTYRDRWRAGDPAYGWEAHAALTRPVPAPRPGPFDRNDPRDPAQRAAAIYHWTPDVADYTDPQQEAELPDVGPGRPEHREPGGAPALRRSYGHWIREVGVDAFRVDTAFYVPPALCRLPARRRRRAPGVSRWPRHRAHGSSTSSARASASTSLARTAGAQDRALHDRPRTAARCCRAC